MIDITWSDWAEEVPLPKTAPVPQCSREDRQILEEWSRSRTMEARLVERARIVLGCLEGKPVSAVAESLKVRPNTVIDWRRRFEAEGWLDLKTALVRESRRDTRRSFAGRCCRGWKSRRPGDKPCGMGRHWRGI